MKQIFAKANQMQKVAIIFNFIVRIIAPLCLFVDPVLGVIVGLLTDGYDYYLLVRLAKLSNDAYQYQDKILDYYWYILIMIYSYIHIDNKLLFQTLLATFIFRSIGYFIYLLNKKESTFLYFPNIQEPIFWIWTINNSYFETYSIFPTLLAIIVFKLLIEYYVHIIHKNPLNQLFQLFNIKTNF